MSLIECGYVATFAGCPPTINGKFCGFDARYFLPALAKVLGNRPQDWQAASWVLLSSALPKAEEEPARKAWHRFYGAARVERKSWENLT